MLIGCEYTKTVGVIVDESEDWNRFEVVKLGCDG